MKPVPTRDDFMIVERENVPLPKVRGRGRRKGFGCNVRLLTDLKPGQSIWSVPEKKMRSLEQTAYQQGIKIKRRRMTAPDDDKYAIFRL